MNKTFHLAVFLFVFSSCKTMFDKIRYYGHRTTVFEESFNSTSDLNSFWQDDSYKSPASYLAENGKLKMTTRPQTRDRVKISSKQRNFGIGSYEWKIFIPKFDIYDQTSIGAFLYHSKKREYEFDFEIGSGTKKHRVALNAQKNKAVVHCTSQFKPFNTSRFLIETEEWHLFRLELLKGKRNKYLVNWYIDNQLVKTLQTEIGVVTKFGVYNSLENLKFIGERLPAKENYVLFDSFIFRP